MAGLPFTTCMEVYVFATIPVASTVRGAFQAAPVPSADLTYFKSWVPPSVYEIAGVPFTNCKDAKMPTLPVASTIIAAVQEEPEASVALEYSKSPLV